MQAFHTFACVFPLLLTFGAAACSAGNGETAGTADGRLGTNAYVVADAGDLQRADTHLKGSGAVAFKQPLGELGSKKSYDLAFTLDDGGSVTLITQADQKLENGVVLVFTRVGAGLSVALGAAGQIGEAKPLDGVDAASALRIVVDVHNDESPAHVLVWADAEFGEEKAVFNSEEDGPTPGQGTGTFWGLRLAKAQVTTAVLGDPKFVEQ